MNKNGFDINDKFWFINKNNIYKLRKFIINLDNNKLQNIEWDSFYNNIDNIFIRKIKNKIENYFTLLINIILEESEKKKHFFKKENYLVKIFEEDIIKIIKKIPFLEIEKKYIDLSNILRIKFIQKNAWNTILLILKGNSKNKEYLFHLSYILQKLCINEFVANRIINNFGEEIKNGLIDENKNLYRQLLEQIWNFKSTNKKIKELFGKINLYEEQFIKKENNDYPKFNIDKIKNYFKSDDKIDFKRGIFKISYSLDNCNLNLEDKLYIISNFHLEIKEYFYKSTKIAPKAI